MRKFTTEPFPKSINPFAMPILPVKDILAIYGRQSTKKQLDNNRESTEQQTAKLIEYAQDLGWPQHKIVLYYENRRKDGTIGNASGTLRIDQRPGLQALVERIEKNEVKAVLVRAIDRLFRDEDDIQPAVFAKICKEHRCIVLTQDDLYDFTHPKRDDRRRFLNEARAAADYNTKHVKGVMLPAREQVSLRGQADSRAISFGYVIVDFRKEIDGILNPNYKKYVPYEPHAKIVRFLFRRYRELGGNLGTLYREITSWPSLFPFFDNPEDAKSVKKEKRGKNEHGYMLTKTGLSLLLSNPVYIGWWFYKGRVINKTNHLPIVDESDFWYAFDRLSPYTLDGERNSRKTSQKPRYRYSGIGTPEALLQGLFADSNNRPVYVMATNPPTYAIIDRDKEHGLHYKVSIAVSELDNFFLERLHAMFEEHDLQELFYKHLKQLQETREREHVSIDSQIEEAKQQIIKHERLKRIATEEEDEQEIRNAIRQLKRLRATQGELEAKLTRAYLRETEIEESIELLNSIHDEWNALPFEKKQRFIQLIVTAVSLVEVSNHFLRFDIIWSVPYEHIETGYMWRMHGTGTMYTEEENAILKEMYPVADRAAILDCLPRRSWAAIMIQARRLGLTRPNMGARGNSSTLHMDVSLQDNEILHMLGEEYSEQWPDKWIKWFSSADYRFTTPS